MSKYLKSFIVNRKSGFTLIELLVVIVIIGILSAFLMFNFIGVRQRSRDAQRKSDLRQVQSALELYRSDVGSYPLSGLTFPPACSSQFASGSITYMRRFPCDPLGSNATYNNGNYYYTSDGSIYTLAACLENVADNDPNDITTPSPGGTGTTCAKYFVLSNP